MSVPPRDDPPSHNKAPAGSTARRLITTQATLTGWANTKDRAARMATPTAKSPAHLGWHARRLGLDPDPDNLSTDELKQAEAAKHAYMVNLSRKAHQARKRIKARRLRVQADELDAAADAEAETA